MLRPMPVTGAGYAKACRQQSKDVLRFVTTGVFPVIASDGYAAEAGVKALAQGVKIPASMPAKHEVHANKAG